MRPRHNACSQLRRRHDERPVPQRQYGRRYVKGTQCEARRSTPTRGQKGQKMATIIPLAALDGSQRAIRHLRVRSESTRLTCSPWWLDTPRLTVRDHLLAAPDCDTRGRTHGRPARAALSVHASGTVGRRPLGARADQPALNGRGTNVRQSWGRRRLTRQ